RLCATSGHRWSLNVLRSKASLARWPYPVRGGGRWRRELVESERNLRILRRDGRRRIQSTRHEGSIMTANHPLLSHLLPEIPGEDDVLEELSGRLQAAEQVACAHADD